MLKNIPHTIGNAVPLFVAGGNKVFETVLREGEKIEIVYLAIGRYHNEAGVYLFGCDKNWNTHTDYYYDNTEDAMEDGERKYPLQKRDWTQI